MGHLLCASVSKRVLVETFHMKMKFIYMKMKMK